MSEATVRNEYTKMRNQNVKLDVYEEIQGEYIELKEGEYIELTLSIRGRSMTLRYHSDSKEGKILKDKVSDIEEGSKISILRTDLDERPICIREMK